MLNSVEFFVFLSLANPQNEKEPQIFISTYSLIMQFFALHYILCFSFCSCITKTMMVTRAVLLLSEGSPRDVTGIFDSWFFCGSSENLHVGRMMKEAAIAFAFYISSPN